MLLSAAAVFGQIAGTVVFACAAAAVFFWSFGFDSAKTCVVAVSVSKRHNRRRCSFKTIVLTFFANILINDAVTCDLSDIVIHYLLIAEEVIIVTKLMKGNDTFAFLRIADGGGKDTADVVDVRTKTEYFRKAAVRNHRLPFAVLIFTEQLGSFMEMGDFLDRKTGRNARKQMLTRR